MLEQEFEHRTWPETAVALHVETTGGRSERQRILFIGLTRIAGGRVEETWETLVNPQVRVPHHVARRLDLDLESLDGAPLARQALEEALSVLGDEPIVGHHVEAQTAPLNYELLWHGLPALRAACFDTQMLASCHLPDLRRPALEGIARKLGVRWTAGPLHGVSRVVADVYLALSKLEGPAAAVPPPVVTGPLESLTRVYGAPPGAGPELPELPGVYVFRDALDAPLYVGKASSLRGRVPQHFTGGSRAARMDDGLLARTARVEHEVTPTEKHARRREVQLIAELQPLYNVQRAVHDARRYLTFYDPPFVRAGTSASPVDGLEVFGPYETSRAVRDTIRTLAAVFELRTCVRRLPARRARMRIPCIRLGTGQCPAPCADLVSTEQYDRRVELARVFLHGGQEAALDAIDLRQRAGGLPEWERALLAAVRSRLMRVRRVFRPQALDQPGVEAQVVHGGEALRRHVLDLEEVPHIGT